MEIRKILTTNALYVVALALLANCCSYLLLGPESSGARMVGTILFASWIFFSYKALKEIRNLQGNTLTFGQGFRAAMFIALCYAAIEALFIFVFTALISPSYLSTQFNKVMQTMEEVYTDEQLEMMQNVMGFMFTPGGISLTTLVSNIFMGLIIALVLGLVMKRDKPLFEQ